MQFFQRTDRFKGIKLIRVLSFFFLFLFLSFHSHLILAEKSNEFHLWPLMDIDKEETDIVWPLLFRYNDGVNSSFGLRPLFSSYENGEKFVRGWDFFWPIIFYEVKDSEDSTKIKKVFQFTPLIYFDKKRTYEDEKQRFILFPLTYQGKLKTSSNQENKSYFIYFPFIWYNNDMKLYFPLRWNGGHFFSFFPIIGTFKNMWEREKISFLLWPLFIKSDFKDHNTLHLAFPFLSYTYGDEKGFKIFPLFRFRYKEDDYFKSYFLWPLIHINKTALDSASPNYTTMLFPIFWIMKQDSLFNLNIFPFYWRTDTPTYKSRGYLYPIFFMRKSEKENYKEIKLLRLYTWRWGESETKCNQFFPIIGHIEQKGKIQYYFLWPLFLHNVYTPEERILKTTLVAPFFYHKYSKWHKDNSEEKSTILFPLYYSNWKTDGTRRRSILWPPLFYEKVDNFERNWYAFFGFFNQKYDEKGNKKISVLYKFFRKVKKADGEKFVEFNPFVFNLKLGNREKEFSLLGWLFSYRKADDKSYYRFLYIPYEFEI